ncbi:MAG: hypothetical protein VKO01_13185 [Cyanobacteriota bacterium]|nr:hypothetical protein [Cyanobacteriota bacterium]
MDQLRRQLTQTQAQLANAGEPLRVNTVRPGGFAGAVAKRMIGRKPKCPTGTVPATGDC